MSRYIRKKKEEIGLSPFAMVFRGQKKSDKTILRVFEYNPTIVNEFEIETFEEVKALKKSKNKVWLNIDGLHEASKIEELSTILKIPANIISDILNPSLRPKVEEFENGLFITVKMLQYDDSSNTLHVENLCLLLIDTMLISFQEQKGDVFNPVRERIRKHNNKIRTADTDYLAFALLDIVVDNYIYIIGSLGEKIETLEENMTNNPQKELLDEINELRKEMNFLRKNVKPAKEMILSLVKIETEYLNAENKFHFKELQDNINEASDLSDSYREILYDQLNIYHTTMSTKLNDIMRVLTVFSVIFIPLTFIAGIYGTNFKYIPELEYKPGYFIMWAVMLLIAFFMLLIFKKKKWF